MRVTRQRGFTLIELMVGLVVASIAVGFIFRIYATSAAAYRTQSQIAELMQTMRTTKQVLTKKLRLAGYYAGAINTLVNTGTDGNGDASGVFLYTPIAIINSSTGPDQLRIVYGDTSCTATVQSGAGPPFNSAETNVTSTECFNEGDVVMAVRAANGVNGTQRGWGCVLQITHVQEEAGKLQHHQVAPFNDNQNDQCAHIAPDWKDGNTVFMRFMMEGYRIKPNDARGVLQYSATGGLSEDWQDLAFGIVDMQFAMQVYQEGDATDDDLLVGPSGTTSAEYDWYSGSNLTNLDLSNKELLQVRVSLVGRTVAEVEGAGTTVTPSLVGDESRRNSNPIGDRDAVTISQISDTSSMYYGNYVYRMTTTVVDLRNLGVGRAL